MFQGCFILPVCATGGGTGQSRQSAAPARVGIASLATSESGLHPHGAHPTEVEQMMGEIVLRVMAWAAQAEGCGP